MKIAIVTDSNSGITQKQAQELGVFVLAMPFQIDGETYYEDITLTQEEFYKKLREGGNISTSQPSPGSVTDLWDKVLQEYDQIVHIPMSSGLSGSCQTAIMLAQEEEYEGKAEAGYDAAAIQKRLEETKFDSTIYITLDTLHYLKKGGRITPAAAALGTILRLKPVLQIQGEKLDAYSKARTYKIAKNTMLDAIAKDIEERFDGKSSPEDIYIAIAHTDNLAAAEEFREEVKAIYPEHDIYIDHLSLSVACHIGPGALAITATKVLKY